MWSAKAVFRLVTHSGTIRRNLLSVLCRCRHDAIEPVAISDNFQAFKGGKHSRQKRMSNSRSYQVKPVNIKNLFEAGDSSEKHLEAVKPPTNLEVDDGPPLILNSASVTEFQSKLANCDHLVYSHEDWEKLKKTILSENPDLKKAWETLCMQLMYHHAQTSLAASFIDYLNTETSSPNISTLSLFVALQGRYGTEAKEQIVEEAFREILKISDVFDSITAKYLIAGLSRTSQWRKALDILEMVKLTTTPASSYYSPIIAAAIREQDIQLAFELLDEQTSKGYEPQDIVLQEILRACKLLHTHDLLERYFTYMWKYSWMLSPAMAKEVELYFTRSEKEKWICKWTSVNTVRGDCHQCKHRLDRIELSSSEFETLQREFLERALVKSNVYLQSNPQEVELFRDFVMEHAPFDVVLDALNIACKGQGRQSVRKSKQLRDIVHYFARERHMKVLVIGRAHMKKWPAADMAYISRHAKAFFTENISSDDPFCLYATLFSGQDCLFVSGDFMRDHKYNLGPAFKETFERWQKSRQIVNFTSSYPAGISVTMPSQFDCGPVKDEKGWHIPYNNGTVNFRSETQPVLCLRYKGERKTASKHSKKKHLSA